MSDYITSLLTPQLQQNLAALTGYLLPHSWQNLAPEFCDDGREPSDSLELLVPGSAFIFSFSGDLRFKLCKTKKY